MMGKVLGRFAASLFPLIFLSACSVIVPEKKVGQQASRSFENKWVQQWYLQPQNINSDANVNNELVVDGNTLYYVEGGRDIIAMDVQSGKVLDSFDLDLSFSSGILVESGIFYIGTSDGMVVALDFNEKRILWQSGLSSEVLVKPKLSGNKLFVHTVDGKIVALDKDNGNQLWLYESKMPSLSLRGISAPLIFNDLVIVGLANGKLAALSAETGIPTWVTTVAVPEGRSDLEKIVDIDVMPKRNGDMVYAVSYQGQFVAIDVRTGDIEWSKEMSSYLDFLLVDDTIFVINQADELLSLDRISGDTLWKQSKLRSRGLTAPIFFNESIVMGDKKGVLYFVNQKTGKIENSLQIDSAGLTIKPLGLTSSIIVVGDKGAITSYTQQPLMN